MFCLEVYVNNKKVAVVGRNNAENYHATVTYWGGHDSVEVSANGASPVDENRISETFSWGKQNITIGDKVTIKVIDCDHPDKPIEINRHDYTEGMEQLENSIIEMAAKYRVKAELEGTDFLSEGLAPDGIYCSFCGKEKAMVNKMIGGPSVHICNECIDICNDIVEGRSNPPQWPEKD